MPDIKIRHDKIFFISGCLTFLVVGLVMTIDIPYKWAFIIGLSVMGILLFYLWTRYQKPPYSILKNK